MSEYDPAVGWPEPADDPETEPAEEWAAEGEPADEPSEGGDAD
jgi:hypothetical protein